MTKPTTKSRLGLLLIKKGLINQQQLDDALKAQITSTLRLGEVFIEQGFLTERQLKKALKRQSRHRFIAALIAMILGPMSFGAFANGSSTSQAQDKASSSQVDQYQGLKALDDHDLSDVQGQGFDNVLSALQNLQANTATTDTDQALHDPSNTLDDLGPLNQIMKALDPMASLFDADIKVSGVTYHENQPRQVIHTDGSIEYSLPKKIAEIAYRNLRIKGADSQHSLGDVVISNIQFSEQSRIRISVRS